MKTPSFGYAWNRRVKGQSDTKGTDLIGTQMCKSDIIENQQNRHNRHSVMQKIHSRDSIISKWPYRRHIMRHCQWAIELIGYNKVTYS